MSRQISRVCAILVSLSDWASDGRPLDRAARLVAQNKAEGKDSRVDPADPEIDSLEVALL
jgi:hypothetical protein